MTKYYYEKLYISNDNEKSTSSDDFDSNNNYNINNCQNNTINCNLSNKKLKIKYIYTHYTNYIFYKNISK
jgi:hypothetical protein